jgi:hypothetical protein
MLFNEHLVRIRHEEMLAEAERIRLVSLVNRQSKKRKSFFSVSLNWMGNLLCKLGGFLQERFGEQDLVDQSQTMDTGIRA